jgi:diaminopimelate epimerase
MGNPHAVTFVEDTKSIEIETIGPKFEHHPMFPERVNTEFIQILNRNEINMRVWERGSGETLACGTGACASAMAAVKKAYCSEGEPILVHLDGGTLKITIAQDGEVSMTGPAEFVYEGETID